MTKNTLAVNKNFILIAYIKYHALFNLMLHSIITLLCSYLFSVPTADCMFAAPKLPNNFESGPSIESLNSEMLNVLLDHYSTPDKFKRYMNSHTIDISFIGNYEPVNLTYLRTILAYIHLETGMLYTDFYDPNILALNKKIYSHVLDAFGSQVYNNFLIDLAKLNVELKNERYYNFLISNRIFMNERMKPTHVYSEEVLVELSKALEKYNWHIRTQEFINPLLNDYLFYVNEPLVPKPLDSPIIISQDSVLPPNILKNITYLNESQFIYIDNVIEQLFRTVRVYCKALDSYPMSPVLIDKIIFNILLDPRNGSLWNLDIPLNAYKAFLVEFSKSIKNARDFADIEQLNVLIRMDEILTDAILLCNKNDNLSMIQIFRILEGR